MLSEALVGKLSPVNNFCKLAGIQAFELVGMLSLQPPMPLPQGIDLQ